MTESASNSSVELFESVLTEAARARTADGDHGKDARGVEGRLNCVSFSSAAEPAGGRCLSVPRCLFSGSVHKSAVARNFGLRLNVQRCTPSPTTFLPFFFSVYST